jgi:hypothetical protein
MESEQPEIEGLWSALEDALKDQFVPEASINGILRLEHILNIAPKGTDSLNDRRFRILARLNEQLPYTFRSLDEKLTTLCGADGYTMELIHGDYTLKVRIELVVRAQYDEVDRLLKNIVPANIFIDLSLRYNQHMTLGTYTHAHLGLFTHYALRNELID